MPRSMDHFCTRKQDRRHGNARITIALRTVAKQFRIQWDATKWSWIRDVINCSTKPYKRPQRNRCIYRNRNVLCTSHWTQYRRNTMRKFTSSTCRRQTVWWRNCRCCRAPKRRASSSCGNRKSEPNREYFRWNIWNTRNRCTSARIGRWSVCRRSIAVVTDRKRVAWIRWTRIVAGMS